MNEPRAKSGGLVRSAVLASVARAGVIAAGLAAGVGGMTEVATADLNPFGTYAEIFIARDDADPLGVVVDSWSGFTGFYEGFGFASDMGQNTSIYSVMVYSDIAGFEYRHYMGMTFANLVPGLFPGFDYVTVYMYIKGDLNPGDPVSNWEMRNHEGVTIGTGVSADGATILAHVPLAGVIGSDGAGTDDIISLYWNQSAIPGPGGIALLAAGVMHVRRSRRRDACAA